MIAPRYHPERQQQATGKVAEMRIRKLLLGAALAMGAVGFMPSPAQAVTCYDAVEPFIGRTCTDCGWVMIGGKPYILFYCD